MAVDNIDGIMRQTMKVNGVTAEQIFDWLIESKSKKIKEKLLAKITDFSFINSNLLQKDVRKLKAMFGALEQISGRGPFFNAAPVTILQPNIVDIVTEEQSEAITDNVPVEEKSVKNVQTATAADPADVTLSGKTVEDEHPTAIEASTTANTLSGSGAINGAIASVTSNIIDMHYGEGLVSAHKTVQPTASAEVSQPDQSCQPEFHDMSISSRLPYLLKLLKENSFGPVKEKDLVNQAKTVDTALDLFQPLWIVSNLREVLIAVENSHTQTHAIPNQVEENFQQLQGIFARVNEKVAWGKAGKNLAELDLFHEVEQARSKKTILYDKLVEWEQSRAGKEYNPNMSKEDRDRLRRPWLDKVERGKRLAQLTDNIGLFLLPFLTKVRLSISYPRQSAYISGQNVGIIKALSVAIMESHKQIKLLRDLKMCVDPWFRDALEGKPNAASKCLDVLDQWIGQNEPALYSNGEGLKYGLRSEVADTDPITEPAKNLAVRFYPQFEVALTPVCETTMSAYALSSLAEETWLNDDIIDIGINALTEGRENGRFLTIPPSKLLSKMPHKDLPDWENCERIFCPVKKHKHWVLAVVTFDSQSKVSKQASFEVYNPQPALQAAALEAQKILPKWFYDHLGVSLGTMVHGSCDSQSDDHSCGLFVVNFARTIMDGKSLIGIDNFLNRGDMAKLCVDLAIRVADHRQVVDDTPLNGRKRGSAVGADTVSLDNRLPKRRKLA